MISAILRHHRLSVLVLLSAAALACDGPDAPSPPPIPEGTLVFEEDFSKPSLGDQWHTGYEGWTIVDGRLTVQGAKNDALWLQEPLPDEFRLRFDARSNSEAGDIKFEILGDGQTHESGYIGIFGGWNNQLNIIARRDEHGDDRLVGASDWSVTPGQTYAMDIVRTDQRLRWYIDGQPFLTYDDPAPLVGDDHRYFGFNNWETDLTFDNLRIYDLAD